MILKMMFRKLISTVDSIDFLNYILIGLFLFLAYFGYLFIKKKLYQDLQSFLFHIRIVLYTLFVILCILSLTTMTIIIEIREGDKDSSVIWTILIVLLMGIYISTCFGAVGVSRIWTKYFSIIILAYISFTGFGYLGFRIIFDFPEPVRFLLTGFWRNDVYQSNHPKGLYFFGDNLPFFLVIWGLTFTLEGEKRGK